MSSPDKALSLDVNEHPLIRILRPLDYNMHTGLMQSHLETNGSMTRTLNSREKSSCRSSQGDYHEMNPDF